MSSKNSVQGYTKPSKPLLNIISEKNKFYQQLTSTCIV